MRINCAYISAFISYEIYEIRIEKENACCQIGNGLKVESTIKQSKKRVK